MRMKGIGKLITEIMVAIIMCAACITGMYYFLRFIGVPEKENEFVVVLSAILTAGGIVTGYGIRFRRKTLLWPDRGPNQGKKRHIFLRFAAMSIVLLIASLWGTYLVFKSSWVLGAGVLLLSCLLYIMQLKWLLSVMRDRNTGGEKV